MYQDQDQLLKTLVSRNLLAEEKVKELQLKSQTAKKPPETIILEEKLVDENKLNTVKAELLNIPPANLKGLKIPRKVLGLIPREVAENYQMVAFKKDGEELLVGLLNPQNFKAIEAVEFLAQKAGWNVKYFLISLTGFKTILRQYQVMGEEVEPRREFIEKHALEVKVLDV